MSLTIAGLQAAQEANLRHIASLRPGGSLEKAIQEGTAAASRYAVSIAHVDTGAMKASMRIQVSGFRGMVYMDNAATNPRTSQRPAEYALYEHRRGGEHAFFARTIAEQGRAIANGMAITYARGLV